MTLKRLLLNAAPVEGGNTPTVPNTPSKEELSGSFEITDSDDVDLNLAEPSHNQEPVKQQEPVVKEPVKQQEPVVKQTTTKQTETKQQEPSLLKPLLEKTTPEKVSKQPARDYTGFTDDEVKRLKSMSNEAFDYMAPILKQRKELEALKDTSYLQHPQAYTLHPEYQKVQAEAQYARTEAQAWQEQLVKIKQGEEWSPLVGVDPKTGKFIYGDKRQPTVQDEEMVRLSMTKCMQHGQNAEDQIRQLPNQFQSIVQRDLTGINQERAKRFDWVANPELLKHELEIDGVGKKQIADIRNDFIGLFPPYQRNTPGVDVAADLFVAMQIYATRLKQAEGGKAIAETLKKEATRVEPSGSIRPRKTANSKFGVTEFDLEGLPQ